MKVLGNKLGLKIFHCAYGGKWKKKSQVDAATHTWYNIKKKKKQQKNVKVSFGMNETVLTVFYHVHRKKTDTLGLISFLKLTHKTLL